ncbi:MAG TPA: sulfatase-like hydrolase/transferase [Anaerolineaceae bacterium]|nr:sulfatase-like hydrolase/transferase [Anaerolineaceae bacterium]
MQPTDRVSQSSQHSETHHLTARQSQVERVSWLNLAALTVLAIYFFLLMEWLFTVTKPSFMDFMTFPAKLGVLLLPGLLLVGFCAPALLLLFAVGRAPWGASVRPWFLWIGAGLPAAFLAATGLLLVDNFTHVVLGFSIVESQGWQRGIYALLFLVLLAAAWRWAGCRLRSKAQARRPDVGTRAQWYASVAVLALSLPMGLLLVRSAGSAGSGMQVSAPTQRPNILLIGTDGLNADMTSIYGNQPDTTPYLKSFAEGTLLAANNFPNATITTGSLVSMFAAKLPTQTRLLYPPDVLRGNDAFQHLPGILKKAGYYNATIGIDYYADPEMLNLQDGFVMINGRSTTIGRVYTLARSWLPENAAYFLSVTGKRLTERLLHIFYVRPMSNPYAEVTQQLSTMSDEDRLGYVISLFRDIDQPLFIHTHLMGTHVTEMDGFLLGIEQFDRLMSGLIRELELMGELDQTLIVVYTDHGHNNVSNVRIPLMFRFPHGAHSGVIANNTQNLDIAPTILDYLGVAPPAWMEGQSLLAGEPPANRPVFSLAPSYRVDQNDRLQLDLSKLGPPFYQFGTVTMVVCQNWYALDTATLTWQTGEVAGYPTPCAAEVLPAAGEAQAMIAGQLEADGFDVTSLRK